MCMMYGTLWDIKLYLSALMNRNIYTSQNSKLFQGYDHSVKSSKFKIEYDNTKLKFREFGYLCH